MSDPKPETSASTYISGGIGVLFSRAVGVIAGICSLWLVTRILSTADFAAYSFAMSVVFILGFTTVFGLERVILLKVSPLPASRGWLRGGSLAYKIAVLVFCLSCCSAVLILLVLYLFPAISANNDLLSWYTALIFIVPTVALTTVLIAWLQSNHVVGRPQSLHGQVDGLRCLGFVAIFFFGGGSASVAITAVLASLIPLILLARKACKLTEPEPSQFGLSDIGDAMNFFGLRLSQIGFLHADIIVMGLLAPPEILVPYIVASRISVILEAAQQVFVPAYTPRARRHLKGGTTGDAEREYAAARTLSFLAVSVSALGFVLFGDTILGLFGSFRDAYGILLIMCLGQLIMVGAGLHSVHLSMTDHLPITMKIQLGGLFFYLVALVTLVPHWGAVGAAVGFVSAQFAVAFAGLAALYACCRIWPFQPISFACYILSTVGLGLAGLWPDYVFFGGILMTVSLCINAYTERALLISVYISCVAEIRRLIAIH